MIRITTEPVSRRLRPFAGFRTANLGRYRRGAKLWILWIGRLSIIRIK